MACLTQSLRSGTSRCVRCLVTPSHAAYRAVIWLMAHAWELAHSYVTGRWKEDPSMQIRSRCSPHSGESLGHAVTWPLRILPPLAHLHFLLMAQTCLPCHWYLVFLSQAVLFASGKVPRMFLLLKSTFNKWHVRSTLAFLYSYEKPLLGNNDGGLYDILRFSRFKS